jgi:hypothetical protein
MSGIYIYPVRHPHPTRPICFKMGRGDGHKRGPSHSRKLLDGWVGEHDQVVCFNVPGDLEGQLRDRLLADGHTRVLIPMLATRAAERQREARTGKKRTANEIHSMNGKTWNEIVVLVRSHLAMMRRP